MITASAQVECVLRRGWCSVVMPAQGDQPGPADIYLVVDLSAGPPDASCGVRPPPAHGPPLNHSRRPAAYALLVRLTSGFLLGVDVPG
jgi:hypothetical protein